jgi:hypothetical protein
MIDQLYRDLDLGDDVDLVKLKKEIKMNKKSSQNLIVEKPKFSC